jgi:hypothetical protein
MTTATKYHVKEIYPKFKNLTTFRRIMHNIRNSGIRRDNRIHKFDNPSGLMFELTNYNFTNNNSEIRRDVNRYRRAQSWETREKTIRIIRNIKLNFKLQKLYEINFQKKVEFYQAMVSRDYKVVTLCDDVIGVVFGFLPRDEMKPLSNNCRALLCRE